MTDYRPIALCNVFFKIISKLLALRLKQVLHLIISENQSAFIPGRAIADNVLITHEVLQFLKTSQAQKRCTMAVKTDMSKAYDRVEWTFISKVLQRLGFHSKWVNLIMQCVSTVSYSYLINDSVHGLVNPKRGIRQGDPLSPYLFILCGQVLSGLCQKAERDGTFQGIKVARGSPRVNHLLFADDTMFFCQTSHASCNKLKIILERYEKASGQKINVDKSSITFSSKTPPETKRSVKETLGIDKEGGSGKYLGLPEHFGRRKKDLFTAIVDRIRQQASSRSTRHLSRAGKLTLLKAVLTAIPTYTMSCFELPVSLCKRIQSILTRFWWDSSDGTRRMCWVAWDNLTKPKDRGGLGLRDIQLFNQALLAKQAWRLLTNPECLLARVLLGKYCHKRSFLEVELPAVCFHEWRSILHGRDLLRGRVGKAIGNGINTKIWKDSWISLDSELKPYGPIPDHALDLTVADLLTTDMKWNKKRVEELLPQVATEVQLLHPGHANTEDIFIWQPLQSGTYTTKSGYYAVSTKELTPLDETTETFGWIKDVWSAKCSPKMKLLLWSIINEAIPLGEQLQKRGINSDVQCIKCKGSETVMHTFFSCPFAQEVWKLIPLRQVVHLATDINFKQALVEFRTAVCLPPSGIATTVLPWVLWAIWSTRNLHVFENRILSPMETATKALNLGREWNNAQQQIQSVKKLILRSRRSTGNNGESGTYTTCRSDAAYDKRSKRAGIAWIFSNGNGTHLSHGSATLESITTPLVAEAIALRSGLLSALELEHQKLKAFSDNLTLIRTINNNMQVKEIFGIVKDIQRISSAFVEISFSHLSRSLNVEADRLAKLSLFPSRVCDPYMG
ncbi:uncharacterized protein LOC111205438 [Brassica napus]|uniref:uncharacterized protein LOC111205438 n=1 Tax=Brassica napus TaxID=3708 RepID=UPI00207A93EF|nr:uncharacterized protein LOC111205438 [Brassica napus]XP_048621964.1 uncharacterized protein LOC111205438 [Brassica napus]XP_048621965.1 uncharacterized protein LOC111205438 [Brassica napus]XP_048621966.1 uncharacterized protein LOC111205438 [Brassica napus]XP_048621967.1 uncharacterized protein LOC111205438 [Brassica napus]XP_048621968.1 uncharacterized protein LOC111205438 [Brassica napus]XP_048621969.1 uncharacterized protein LOC111205438 [Brassica napus]XP_048621970.1 uncharacterized p